MKGGKWKSKKTTKDEEVQLQKDLSFVTFYFPILPINIEWVSLNVYGFTSSTTRKYQNTFRRYRKEERESRFKSF